MDALSALKMMTGAPLGAPQADPLGGSSAISALELAQLKPDAPASGVTAAAPAESFQSLLGGFVGEVNAKQVAAGDTVSGLLAGKNVSLHQAMISMEEASVSFQMMVEVRNNLLNSYQELMRMQI